MQLSRISLQQVGSPHETTRTGTLVCPEGARDRNPSPLTDRDLHDHDSPLPAKRHQTEPRAAVG